jgi:hypothetical protein
MSYAIPCSGKLGRLFNRVIADDPGEAKAYAKLAGHAEKAAFRQAWARRRLLAKTTTTTTAKKEVSTHQQRVKGQYVPFKILWDREGSDMAGYKAPIHITGGVCVYLV